MSQTSTYLVQANRAVAQQPVSSAQKPEQPGMTREELRRLVLDLLG